MKCLLNALYLGLRANVTSSNQTFTDAVTTGGSVDSLYGTLKSQRNSLVQAAELGSSTHSVLSNVQTASDYSNEALYRATPVNDGTPALLDQVNRLEQRMMAINQSAERAAGLTSKAFANGKPVYVQYVGSYPVHENFEHLEALIYFPESHTNVISIYYVKKQCHFFS